MKISLSPMRRDLPLDLDVQGETLILNGQSLDLSAIPDGATLPRAAVSCDWLVGDIERIDGVLHLTLALAHGADAPEQTLFPSPVMVTKDGPVLLPPYENPPAAPEEEPLP